MAHYAILDGNDIVTLVTVGKDEHIDGVDWEQYYGGLRTSYNTRGGVYYDPATGLPAADQSKSFRKNYAGIGDKYDRARDAFIPPQPYPSWVLNETTCLWDSPVPYPTDGGRYGWDESTNQWIALPV